MGIFAAILDLCRDAGEDEIEPFGRVGDRYTTETQTL
jgi:hypothetical protein